ncbi:hypothetical protein TNCV_171161 [Trichonephila clavipes]|nr:hypothetical protein TNCV_171161 [Trichonephila clavipes]
MVPMLPNFVTKKDANLAVLPIFRHVPLKRYYNEAATNLSPASRKQQKTETKDLSNMLEEGFFFFQAV